ncbi:SEC14-like protein 2 isoform X3 [Vespa velutina]|uniref:SEC14-like protein 2 isoform X3 n=1 Tax=Vespa velutina TaxID=202808 RepID=UPI001FB4150C|nr:SEC14-like protein 2 isoform X3 [Vespa velutina]
MHTFYRFQYWSPFREGQRTKITMSTSLNLLDDQRFALMKFRRIVADVLQPHHDDRFLLRWLRARSWNVTAAEKMLRNSLQWRKQWEVDKIEEWDEPELIKNYLPHGLSGFDKENAPVVVVPFAGFDIYGTLHVITKRDVIKSFIKYLENYLRICNEQVKKHGPLAGKITVIYDMEGFNLKQYLWRPAGEVVISAIQMYEANYPEILKMCYIINAPKMFSFAFSVAKRFLNEYTLSKIQIFKADPTKWKPAILELVPTDQMPAHFGGTLKDPDGNPKLVTKICQGGKIPKEMYMDKMESDKSTDYTTVIIRKGDKLELSLTTSEEGSLLSWDFRTEDYDIKFGILKEDTSGMKTEIVPITKIASHKLNEIGVVTCDKPATYSVIFDNTYSVMRNKKIHYSVRILPPSEELKE